MKYAIDVRNVTKKVKKRTGWFKTTSEELLKNVSLSIPQEEFVVMLGKNGSGKSTLLKCITGMLYSEEGEIYVNGKSSFQNRHALTKEMGILFGQKSLLFTDLKAIDYLQLLKKIYGLTEKEFQQAIQMVHKFLPCEHLLSKQVRGMSYGERMKMELLSTTLHSPNILILDEPFVGLDPLSQQQLLKFIQSYKETTKATIILTTHQFLDILKLADRAIIIENGIVSYDGDVDVLLKSYQETKIIKIQWAKPLRYQIQDIMDGVSIIEQDEKGIKIEANLLKCSVEEVVKKLISMGEVSDVDIQSIPIEKVVESLYEKNPLLLSVVS